jgi:hypothetical protein
VVFTHGRGHKLFALHPSSSQNVAQRKILRSTITSFAIILSLQACYFLDLCFFIFPYSLNASILGDNIRTGFYGHWPAVHDINVPKLSAESLPCVLAKYLFQRSCEEYFPIEKIET